ncbi:hypothetical protein IVB12_25850 [Bradyrhizobium sp. 179]|uniref:hypothetical protein n=1 Tax=Bradyrhizobium sp. 179 TaxID=2782648 RepID=UPI001FFBDF02|nr:hypothetical protein [Bradyrhizobium sp. 179]MCK1545271.1 hypothetical protein [Bradyrhizobium sp. 179]
MRLPEKQRTALHESYWSKIEALFRGSEWTFDAFARDYVALMSKATKQEKSSELYYAFRNFFPDLKQRLAEQQSFEKVPMSDEARSIFEVLRAKLLEIDTVNSQSGSLSAITHPTFFLEVLPRRYRISLLLALDFDELDGPLNIAQDATQWKFLVNATHEGGVLLNFGSTADIENAIPLIRQAHAASED